MNTQIKMENLLVVEHTIDIKKVVLFVKNIRDNIMAGLSASGLKTQIRSYTEVDSNVLTDAQLENIILNAQYRIFRDVPIDADRKQQLGNLVAGQESINAPAGSLFIRGIQVYDTAGSRLQGLIDG